MKRMRLDWPLLITPFKSGEKPLRSRELTAEEISSLQLLPGIMTFSSAFLTVKFRLINKILNKIKYTILSAGESNLKKEISEPDVGG